MTNTWEEGWTCPECGMIDTALTTLHSHDWYLHMLWEDSRGWGATVRDALEGTCEHHATGRGDHPALAIELAMERLAKAVYDEPERTTTFVESRSSIAQRANSILSTLGIGKKASNFRLLGGSR